jgi:hypothetical protein
MATISKGSDAPKRTTPAKTTSIDEEVTRTLPAGHGEETGSGERGDEA